MLSGVIDFVLAFVVLLGMMLFYGITPTINVIWLPLLLLFLPLPWVASVWLTSCNFETWASALRLPLGDTIPFITQFWLFATPLLWCGAKRLAYPSSLLSELCHT